MKKLLIIAVAISLGWFTIAKASEDRSVTPKEFVESITSVPGKVGNQITIEIDKTKKFQAKNWAEMKAQWQRLVSKFQAN